MPEESLKRKGEYEQALENKRTRLCRTFAGDSDASDFDSEHEHPISPTSFPATENDSIQSSYSTPCTPLSSKSSPRFPSQLKTIACSFADCEKTFNRPANLAQHLRSHTNTRLFKCSHAECAKDFLRESHLKHHVKSQHSDVRDYICDWVDCGKSFVTGTRLRRHRAAHENKESFRCDADACGQLFRKHGTLQKHIAMAHEGKSPFVCRVSSQQGEECGAGFDTAGKLKSHEGRAHGDKRFWCIVCSSATTAKGINLGQEGTQSGFSTYAQLQTHLAVEHAPTCEECDLQCASQRALKSHIDIVHGPLGMDERRKYACGELGCGRAFTKRGNLNVHVQTIHGQKKFVCGSLDHGSLKNVADWNGLNACGQAFSTKQSLEGHIRATHLGLSRSRRNLDNLLVERKNRRSKSVPTLVRLTGAGYDHESGRHISCLISDCEYRFMRDYDLEVHLSFHHGLFKDGMKSQETQASLSTWDGSLVSATYEDLEAEHALDMQFEMEGIERTFQEECGKRRYVKGVREDGFYGQSDQDVVMIDPTLR